MASMQWSTLPADILSVIGTLLTSDVDILRFRSVCSSWRSSLPRPQNPISFPLKLPLLRSPANLPYYPEISVSCTLNRSTIYRLSPPATGPRAADPSFGWLFKVSETNPNTFSLLDLMTAEKLFIPPRTIRNQLNLLNYRISEIRKSYVLGYPGSDWTITVSTRKVICLSDYVADCKFAALVLRIDGSLTCWKFGDDDWTPVDTKGYLFQDVMMCNGTCYAVDNFSVLVSFDSNLNLTVITPPTAQVVQNFLVECESDLYMVSRITPLDVESCFRHLQISPCPREQISTAVNACFGLKLSKLNKANGRWKNVRDLGDRVLILGVDSSMTISARDFKGCKGNRIYLNDLYFSGLSDHDMRGVYHLDERRAFIFTNAADVGKIFYPGRWL